MCETGQDKKNWTGYKYQNKERKEKMKYTKFKNKYGNSEDLLVNLNDLETYMQGNMKKVKDNRNELIDGVWKVHPIMITDNNVFVVCPVCGEIHGHNVDMGEYIGGRTVHCKVENDDCAYDIQLIVA
jgi:hypothetical protein